MQNHTHELNNPATLDGAQYGVWPRSIALWMAAFYVALYIIRPWEKLFPWLVEIRFERVYAILMIAVAITSAGSRFRLTSQTGAVMLFLASLHISAQFAIVPELCTALVWRYDTLAAFYVVLILVIRTPYEMIWIISCYVFTMWLYLAKALWEFFVHNAGTRMMGVVRLQGIEDTYSHPNDLAMSIVISLPMLYFLFRVRGEFCHYWPRTLRKLYGVGLATYLLLAIMSIILTNSRGGMLSFVLFVGLLTMRGKGVGKKIQLILAGSVLLATIWLTLAEETRGRYRTIWDPDSGPRSAKVSGEGRWYGFLAGTEIFKSYPVLGIGPGNFIPYRTAYLDGVPANPHNLAGQILAEGGLLGGGCFLLVTAVTLLNCRRIRFLARGSPDVTLDTLSHFAIAGRISVVLLMFEGLVKHNVYRFNWVWLAAFSLLAVEHVIRISGRERDPDEKW